MSVVLVGDQSGVVVLKKACQDEAAHFIHPLHAISLPVDVMGDMHSPGRKVGRAVLFYISEGFPPSIENSAILSSPKELT